MPASLPSPHIGRRSADLSSAFALIQPHLGALDRFLREETENFEPEIRPLVHYCLEASGKRIRPALVFFSGWRSGGEVDAGAVRLAAVIEMVHLATLVHDDIMDQADLRRRRKTAAKQFGTANSVLLGDALFADAVRLAAGFPTPEICRRVAEATQRVCSGEIIQTLRRGDASVSVEQYYRVIELKTAELFSVSCFLGSRQAGLPEPFVTAARDFGRHLGIAYQIYDDLADFFGREDRIGKTLGTDFASGKVTLPLILLLERTPEAEREALAAEFALGGAERFEECQRRMEATGVFAEVSGHVGREIAAAERALGPFALEPAAGLLSGFGKALRDQVGNLRPPGLL